MIRLTHLTGSRAGQEDLSPNAVLKIGRASDCDVRFDGTIDRTVSSHHCEIRFTGDGYMLIDTQSSNGTLLNGQRITEAALNLGDVIHVGGEAGPQVRFDLADEAAAPGLPPAAAAKKKEKPVKQSQDEAVADAAAKAVAKLRQQRAQSGGAASGQTMAIMLSEIGQLAETQEKKSKKTLYITISIAAAIILAIVVAWQVDKAKYANKAKDKGKLDAEIASLQQQIQLETDEQKLSELVAKLELLSGKAEAITTELESSEKGRKAIETSGGGGGDFIDKEMKAILTEFEAGNSYAIPPLFKQTVKKYLEEWAPGGKAGPHVTKIWERRKQYWPMISRAFAEERVPEPMAYVSWQESQFDPEICSWVGARGMWQFMPYTARNYGLQVDSVYDGCKPAANTFYCPCGGTDQRTDPYLASKAAAKYLGDLLAEFGMESFMLAIASYNKGEAGMRKILRDRKLRRRSEREFWHLYYLKLLPEETMEYVPRIVAAAIMGRRPAEFGLK